MPGFEYIFPSIRGIQSGREYYVSMCPLKLIPKIFIFDDDELPPELRCQRVLNKGRLPEMVRYLVKNPRNYVFSALTASIDADVKFHPLGKEEDERNVGTLHLPMKARCVINDGQHRRAAIESALKEVPDIADETIAVVFFIDVGLDRSQQMFADLNRYAVRPTRSLSILYDHRDDWSAISKAVIRKVSIFVGLTETERSSISNRSVKLFTLSGIYHATHILLENQAEKSVEERISLAVDFWNGVAKHMGDWKLAKARKVAASELRRDYVHSHAIALAALGRAGSALLREHPRGWKLKLAKLREIDWSKENTSLWEGRTMVGGHVQKNRTNIILTGNAIKKALGLTLSGEERALERAIGGENRGKVRR